MNNFSADLFQNDILTRHFTYDYFKGYAHSETTESKQSKQYAFYVTNDLYSSLPNSTLVIYNELFKEVYLQGWRYMIFLFIEFDERGLVKNQFSKIYSKRDLKNEEIFINSTSKELGPISGNEGKSDKLICQIMKYLHIV